MVCCTGYCAAEAQFNHKVAKRDLRRYRRRGADATTRLLLAELRPRPLEGRHLLDVGGGIGVISGELSDARVASAVTVEASPAYLEVAQREVGPKYGSRPTQFVPGDFAVVAGTLPDAGVVTSIEYRLHQVGPIYGGAIFFPAAKAKEVLRLWREFCEQSPDELVNQATGATLEGTPVFGVAACYCGPVGKGEELLQPLRKFAKPFADMLGPMTYIQIQSMFEPFFPPGRLVYTKSNFLRSLGDDVIENLAQFVGKCPSPYTFAPFVEHWHGAATRVAPGDTAFPHRHYSWNFFAWSMWTDPAESEKNIRWTRECWEGLKPFLIAGAYGNYVTDEGDTIAREAYGCNYDRLVALKNEYDPTNFFRMNHNVKPTKAAQATT
jgi:hypothetical protein